MSAGKHRAAGQPVERGWTRWPQHRDPAVAGPAAHDGMEEFARQWVVGMKLRERENHRRRMAGCN